MSPIPSGRGSEGDNAKLVRARAISERREATVEAPYGTSLGMSVVVCVTREDGRGRRTPAMNPNPPLL